MSCSGFFFLLAAKQPFTDTFAKTKAPFYRRDANAVISVFPEIRADRTTGGRRDARTREDTSVAAWSRETSSRDDCRTPTGPPARYERRISSAGRRTRQHSLATEPRVQGAPSRQSPRKKEIILSAAQNRRFSPPRQPNRVPTPRRR